MRYLQTVAKTKKGFFHRGQYAGLFKLILLVSMLLSVSILFVDIRTVGSLPSHFDAIALQQPAGPLHVSTVNPRYFADQNDNIVYLTGSHTWANFQDIGYSPPPIFDYNTYLDFLQDNGHNFIRLWVWEQSWQAPWSSEIGVTPMPYQRSGPGIASDGQPKFDLTKFDQAYFDRLRSRIVQAGDRGIYVSVMLFDGWSVGTKNSGGSGNPWMGHPFNAGNNINGINGDPNNDGNGYESQNLSIPVVTTVQEAYVRKVIDTVNDLDNVLYEICNECNSDSTAWQYHMIDFIHGYEETKSKQHPVGMTVEYPDGNNGELFASPADWVSPNDYADPPASDGGKVIIADTDHIWGIGGDRQWVWKSFTRGINPIFMDCYNPNYCEGANPNDATWVSLRLNMGYTLLYTDRMDLSAMFPYKDLCSTGYCLANPTDTGAEYLVYLPDGGSVDVDLSGSPVELSVEWFDPRHGTTIDAPVIFGGSTQTFSAPFSGDAVLYIYTIDEATPIPGITNTPIPSSSTPAGTGTVPVTQVSTSISSSPTPMSPTSPLPCAQGFLLLGGFLSAIVRSGTLRRKRE